MNFLDKELEKRTLPNLFCDPNGRSIKNVEEWEQIMRPYLKEIILTEEYGKMPPFVQPEVNVTVLHKDNAFANKAVCEKIEFTFNYNGCSHTIPTHLIYPKNKKDPIFFININFSSELQSLYMPTEEIIDNGVAVFNVFHEDITKDNADFNDGLAKIFQMGERETTDTGKIVYWAYMAMRMMDYLKIREEAKNSKIGVSGHSRLGKTALLAAALDERFDFVCCNNSGCSGAALSRGRCEGSETLKIITTAFPFWFCKNYLNYVENLEALPFDQHAVISLVAPRLVLIGAAVEDLWADPNGQFLACYAASPIWKLYGKQGLVSSDRLPLVGDRFNDGKICFHLREGTHFFGRKDWNIYMQTVKKHFNLS